MSDAQAWTVIIGLMTLLAGSLSFAFQLMGRTFVAELRAGFSGVDARFAATDAKIEILTSKVDAQGRRLDGLDADVQAITRRLLDGPDAA